MIRNFKFLTDNDTNELEFGGFVNDLHDGFASWMWTGSDYTDGDPHWVIDEMNTTNVLLVKWFIKCFNRNRTQKSIV